MKAKLLHYLSATAYGASFIAGLNLIGVATFLPAHIAKPLMLVPPLFGVLGHSALAIGDYLDDGEKNGSFKPGGKNDSVNCAPLALLAAALIAVFTCTSCTVTTAPDGTKVERTDTEAVDLIGKLAIEMVELFTPAAPAAPVVYPAK